MTDTQTDWWAEHGYLAGREIGGGLWMCVAPMIFTYRVMVCDPGSVYDHACYERLSDALEAYEQWDGQGQPPGPYTRYKGGYA